jgi:hypothetical protein
MIDPDMIDPGCFPFALILDRGPRSFHSNNQGIYGVEVLDVEKCPK